MAADGVVPDVRDGLTPGCRRALCALRDEFRGSARIVDDVLRRSGRDGGRRAIYGELVRMARAWELRHPLVDARGDLGSLNGDEAASAEYTLMRLAAAGGALLDDAAGSDDPPVLPAGFPNLLVNGSFSVATGDASSIPPHNLREVADAAVALIDDPGTDVDGLMRHVGGPDFPTGGVVVADGLRDAYATGRGEVRLRARTHVETGPRGDAIVVSELPFMVSTGGRGGVLAEVGRAAKRGRVAGIAGVEDRSDEHVGLRIVVALAPGADAARVLDALFEHTSLERRRPLALVAAVDGAERTLSLRAAVGAYVEHRRVVVAGRDGVRSGDHALAVVRDELLAVAERHGDARRSEIVPAADMG